MITPRQGTGVAIVGPLTRSRCDATQTWQPSLLWGVMQGGPGFQSDGSVRDIIQASGDVRGFENSKFLRIFLQVLCLAMCYMLYRSATRFTKPCVNPLMCNAAFYKCFL